MKQLTPEEQTTLESYNNHALHWVGMHSLQNFWLPELEKFHQYLPEGKILELGSGGGRDAKELLAIGYDYTGTDISEGLLKEAQKNNPEAKFIHKSVYDLDFPAESFDGFWACAMLLHIPKSRIDEALQKIHHVIRTGAIGFISLKAGEGENLKEDSHTDGVKYKRFFAYYKNDEFREILKRNGFDVLESYSRVNRKGVEWLMFFISRQKTR